jgi:L-ribulose-5-phosphate 4-epimerase
MTDLDALKEEVFRANTELVRLGLVTGTWGNASAVDRSRGIVVIKPSGVDYASMAPGDMAVVDLDGRAVGPGLRPSSDTATHLELYRAFEGIGGVVHTHSPHATMFAQASREIPCLGTTHADHFRGAVPVTRFLSEEEVRGEYERETGRLIVERFRGLDPLATPGVLVAGHAPFAWGAHAAAAVENSLVLERVAQLALGTLGLDPGIGALPEYIQEKHYRRKHGPDAYYGQGKIPPS